MRTLDHLEMGCSCGQKRQKNSLIGPLLQETILIGPLLLKNIPIGPEFIEIYSYWSPAVGKHSHWSSTTTKYSYWFIVAKCFPQVLQIFIISQLYENDYCTQQNLNVSKIL